MADECKMHGSCETPSATHLTAPMLCGIFLLSVNVLAATHREWICTNSRLKCPEVQSKTQRSLHPEGIHDHTRV